MSRVLALTFLLLLGEKESLAFQPRRTPRSRVASLQAHPEDDAPSQGLSRREACRVAVGGALISGGLLNSASIAHAEEGYKPAKRPFAYRVDTTQPPTLIPISGAQKEMKILEDLGKGSGTAKAVIVNDSVNLNNILNKAVFGAIDAVKSATEAKGDDLMGGPGYASFVCMGVPVDVQADDVGLAKSLTSSILKSRNGETALGLAFCPMSTQQALDSYLSTGDLSTLTSSLTEKGVSSNVVDTYVPLFKLARSNGLRMLALSPEKEDIKTARAKGLQFVDPDRRTTYVSDPNGFIALSQDPKFRVYSDRSLLKDFTPLNNDDSAGLFFSERILVHETAANVAAQYAVQRPDSMVIVVAPTPDLRYLQGINGRIARLCAFLNPQKNKVTENSVTTILLNPSAKDTLSMTNYIRLEVGTGPETLDYQSKVSDYLWFSTMPKVNMIPRLMDG